MASRFSSAAVARRMIRQNPTRQSLGRRRRTNHPHELEAEITWKPSASYSDDYELPDWIAGAD